MDWKNLMADTEASIATFSKEVPQTVKGFGQMGQAAKADGALSEKTKEFIALGIAVATRCDSCIGFHVRSLVRLGATREELCEALAMEPIWAAVRLMPTVPRRFRPMMCSRPTIRRQACANHSGRIVR